MHAATLEVTDMGNAMGEDAVIAEDAPPFSTPPTQPMYPPETPALPKPAAAAPSPTPALPMPAAAAPTQDPTPAPPRRPHTHSVGDSNPLTPLHRDVRTWTRGADWM